MSLFKLKVSHETDCHAVPNVLVVASAGGAALSAGAWIGAAGIGTVQADRTSGTTSSATMTRYNFRMFMQFSFSTDNREALAAHR